MASQAMNSEIEEKNMKIGTSTYLLQPLLKSQVRLIKLTFLLLKVASYYFCWFLNAT